MSHRIRTGLFVLSAVFFLVALTGSPETAVSQDASGAETEVDFNADAQRNFCAVRWTEQYRGRKADIEVRTRGAHNEVAVFYCPDCSLYDHFIRPYLESEYRGKTGMMRLSECGFRQAVFKGNRGTQEIVIDVQHVFPNPRRAVCVQDWSMRYQKKYPQVKVSSRGELDESIVFSCSGCTSQEGFILPFLETDHEGRTAMDKLRSCGFTEVVFTNASGTSEVVKQVR